MVPQLPYTRQRDKSGWTPKSSVLFFEYGRLGVKLLNVMKGVFRGIDNRDDPAFDGDSHEITIQMHVGP